MATEQATYKLRIITDPEIMVGKPVVRGTRIPVEVVIAHLADNPDLEDLFEAYPRLTLEDVKACLAYAEERIRKSPKQKPGGQATPSSPVTP